MKKTADKKVRTKESWPMVYRIKDGRSLLVRPVAYGDARALHTGLLKVIGEGIYICREPESVGDLAAVIESVRQKLTRRRTIQLVADLEDRVVGSISMNPGSCGSKSSHWCSLEIWLETGVRGLSIGSALLESALSWGRDQGFSRVIAQVFASNEAAIALFRKFGFMVEGRQRNLFVLPGIGYVDNLLMSLEITPEESSN